MIVGINYTQDRDVWVMSTVKGINGESLWGISVIIYGSTEGTLTDTRAGFLFGFLVVLHWFFPI